MNARHSIVLAAAAALTFAASVPALSAPEGLGVEAPATAATETITPAVAATAPAPAAEAKPVSRATDTARTAQPRARQQRAARTAPAISPRAIQQVRYVAPRTYRLASTAADGCRSFQCLTGGVILLGVGF
ncbi:MAG: hypothetical protein J0H62_06330 [Rhizobiales bacterium]|nr:hypothetical protein [Hyphomicrobiales bacterium]